MRRRRKLSGLIAWITLVLLVSGCSGFPEMAQPCSTGMTVGEIFGSHIAGQTFIAHHGGLNGVEVLLATYARENQGTIIFHLRDSFDSTDIAGVEVPAKAIQDNAFHRFSFPALPDSAGKSYYFFLESPDSGPGDAITTWQGTADSYKEGVLYLAGEPQSGQLVFILRYDLLWVAWELLHASFANLDTIILAILLFLLPGYVLIVWPLFDKELKELDVIESLASAAGISVAIYPLLFLISRLIGIRLGRGSIVALLIASCVLIAFRMCWRRGEKKPNLLSVRRPNLPALVFAIVFVFSAVVRFTEVWGLSVPLWGDSYQHAMMAQLMVDNGGLFSSWEPYAPLASFTYHFGFHSLVTTFHWLTGVGVVQSVIVVGQILNLLTVSGAYLLTTRLTRNRWAGVAAATITGLVSHMPAFYFNWGRYTQLAGQVILPVAMVLSYEALEGERRDYRHLATAALALAGLVLTHYRVVIFYVLFVAILVLSATYRSRSNPRRAAEVWLRGIGIGLFAVFLTLPWLLNIRNGLLPQQLTGFLSPASRSGYLVEIYNAWGDVDFVVGYRLIAIALVGTILGVVIRQRNVLVMVAWVGSLLLLANPNRLGLPGVGIVNNFAILIAMYIPLSFLGGFLVGHIIEFLRSKWSGMEYLAALAMLLFGLWGGRSLVSIFDQSYMLVSRADEQAMEWIKGHTPQEARFLVNSFFPPDYGGTTVVGSDAGWWIPLLAGRQNMIPPVPYVSERSSQPGYREEVNAFNQRVVDSPVGTEAMARYLRENGVTHVYIGRAGGHLKAEELLMSPYYRNVYAKDGVWIFELVE